MPEPDDDLAALRRADPVDQASLPSADDPEARALFERITMSEAPTNDAADRQETDRPVPMRAPVRPPRWAAAAAVLVLAAIAGAVALGTSGDGKAGDEAARRDVGVSTSATTGPVTPGPIMGSCVEVYDLGTLERREVAFAGTVQRVDGDRVTFAVERWFRGGAGASTTLAGASTLAGSTSAGDGVPLDPGARLLVAGDGGFAWGCGFTQPYDDDVADAWSRALG